MIRDNAPCARWYYLVPQPGEPGAHELWGQATDPDLPVAKRKKRLMRGRWRAMCTGDAAASPTWTGR